MANRTFPAAHRRQHPGLARVFDENAAQNDSTFSTYLQDRADQRVLTTLVEELFRVLEYTVIPVGSRPDGFDTVIRKGTSEYPIHTTSEGKPSRTALQQLTAAHTNSNVPHSILVSAVTPPSERTNRVAEHSGVRVIEVSELRELVEAAIARLTDPVPASETEDRRPSATPAKVKRLVAKLEAACDKIDTLVDQQEFAEATKRHDTVRDAASKARSLLPAGSGNQQPRERLSAVETRVAGLTSALQSAYRDRLAAGDSHVETVNTAVDDGDVTLGLRACEDARSAYTDAKAIADHSGVDVRGTADETVQHRLETVTQLEQQLHVIDQVQEAEATIGSLAAIVADANTTTRGSQSHSKPRAAAQAGHEQLNALPDDLPTPELQARVTALQEHVEQFERVAQRHRSPGTATSVDEVTDDRATETTRVIRTADDVADSPRQPAPMVLRIHEELFEDGRRTAFRAETLAGESVQFDVWHRHSDVDAWAFNKWYLLENVRGQHWTVANGTGVTLSTTATVTATSYEPAEHGPSGTS